ncbi:amidohydrolase [Actinomadura sp. DSM 109109]|nr:amidohydrolase [Actinomadura lepetitiana]
MDTGELKRRVDTYLARCEQELIGVRRDLHMHPEVAFEEHRTTQVIVEFLQAVGLRPWVLPSGTGVVCDIRGGDGPIVALRADIDALAQVDTKTVPYRSTVANAAHNCGHDVHTTIELGAGRFLAMLAEAGLLRGTVRLIFQPGEEFPGGSQNVIDAGALDGVERIFALHCDPTQEVGRLGLKTGGITASYTKVLIKATGRGGHTARPFETEDLITGLSKIAHDLPAVLARRIDARLPHVLTWGRMTAGLTANAIPPLGDLEGTLRCFHPQTQEFALAEMRKIIVSMAEPFKIKVSMETPVDMPPTMNEASSVEIFRDAGLVALGEDKVGGTEQSLGGEDFSLYLGLVKGAYARWGVRRPGAPEYGLHHVGFDVDERCIALGVRLMVFTALRALDRSRSEA